MPGNSTRKWFRWALVLAAPLLLGGCPASVQTHLAGDEAGIAAFNAKVKAQVAAFNAKVEVDVNKALSDLADFSIGDLQGASALAHGAQDVIYYTCWEKKGGVYQVVQRSRDCGCRERGRKERRSV